uniref:Putative RNA-directed DNA polymerase n=1 Tax=Schizaphis graminum TaxID=13262 RepID=A0A2S2PUK6_SCHGA
MAIFLDLAKAFDTVNHIELCNILPSFGLNNSSLKWFISYLNNRKQIVQIMNSSGEELSINCGVPQGSVLGPLLFILYINSICDIKIDGRIITYADDMHVS